MSYEVAQDTSPSAELVNHLNEFYDDYVVGASSEVTFEHPELDYWLRVKYKAFSVAELTLVEPIMQPEEGPKLQWYKVGFGKNFHASVLHHVEQIIDDDYIHGINEVELAPSLVSNTKELAQEEFMQTQVIECVTLHIGDRFLAVCQKLGAMASSCMVWLGHHGYLAHHIPKTQKSDDTES